MLRVFILGASLHVFLTDYAFGQASVNSRSAVNMSDGQLASDYPRKPIRFIVPFPPGGATDILARIIGQKLSENWRQQVVIDNRPGAGAVVGAAIASESTPDGYTLLLVSVAHAINESLHKKLPYQILTDFSPVILAAVSPLMLVIHPSVPANSVKELIALAKAKPGQYSYASAGNGTAAHLAGVQFTSMAGIELVHVPYKGGAAGLLDVMAGRVSMMFPNVPTALPHVKSGKLRLLGVTGVNRLAELPSVHTVAEAGLPEYEVTTWYGVAVPTRTPKQIIEKLNMEIAGILRTTTVVDQFTRHGLQAVTNSPEQFQAHIKTEIERWRKVIGVTGIRAN